MAGRRALIQASRGRASLASAWFYPGQGSKALESCHTQAVLGQSYRTYMREPCINEPSFVTSTSVRYSSNHGSNLLRPVRFYSSANFPEHQEMGMPALSPTMEQGNIAKWRKKVGDRISPGDVLCEIETDKATLEMEAMEEGYLAKILCNDGAKDIPVGQPIAILVESEGDVSKFSDYEASGSSLSLSVAASKESVASAKESAPLKQEALVVNTTSLDDRINASPAAKKIAEEKTVSLASIKGTGPNGRIVKADVDDYIASDDSLSKINPLAPASAAAPASAGDYYTDLPHTQIRRITAQRLLQSKQTIPHYYVSVDTCVDELIVLRSKLNKLQESSGGKRISINDLVIKATAMALCKAPECNSSWNDDFIRQYRNVNISVAVQTDFGLMVPVIKDADKKGLATIAEEVKSLAEKAKQNQLKPMDYEGGTFTITNLGGPFGVKQFCAIINPPQACILAVGTIEKRVVPADKSGEYTTGSFMSVTLSCDHRVVDGAISARWIGAFKGYIEDPSTLLL